MSGVLNLTPYAAVSLPSLSRDDYELTLVVVQARFHLPSAGVVARDELRPLDEQGEIQLADDYYGDPATTSLAAEGQSAYVRPGTDISMRGDAWAPGGRPTTQSLVGLRVANRQKGAVVLGERVWTPGLAGLVPSRPIPFTSIPLRYERCFGGTAAQLRGARARAADRNPVGRGIYPSEREAVGGLLPNFEDPRHPITSYADHPPPHGFGPIARHWQPRRALSGTYDDAWLEDRVPLWPADFDERFFLSAPVDLQGGPSPRRRGTCSCGGYVSPRCVRVHVAPPGVRGAVRARAGLDPSPPRPGCRRHRYVRVGPDDDLEGPGEGSRGIGRGGDSEALGAVGARGVTAFAARVAGVGLASPLGLYSAAAIAAARAGITRIKVFDGAIGRGDDVRVSMLVDVDGEDRASRAAFFAAHAFREALAPLSNQGFPPIPCLLSLPRNIDPEPLLPAGQAAVHATVDMGRAGFFVAMQQAIAVLERGAAPLVVVAGIDSLVDRSTLEQLVGANRVLGRSNPDGLIPGEGVACLLLGTPTAVPRHVSLGCVLSPHTAIEPIPFTDRSGRASNALALGRVFKGLARQAGQQVDEVFAGVTTEAFFGRELSHAYLRAPSLMPEPLRTLNVAEAFGDLGAAAGAIALVSALGSFRKSLRRPVPNASALAYASSDDGWTGGCIARAA